MAKRVSRQVTQEVLTTYRELLNVNETARKLRLHPGIVTEVVETQWGSKDERWKTGSELAQLKKAQKAAKQKPVEPDMGPRVDAKTINRKSPDDLCRIYLGDRFQERHGSYWLDGRHCPDINVRMRAVSRELARLGLPPLPVPEWRV